MTDLQLFDPNGVSNLNNNIFGLPFTEESMNSREFWMFVGSLLFFVSALYIIILTSLPYPGFPAYLKSRTFAQVQLLLS